MLQPACSGSRLPPGSHSPCPAPAGHCGQPWRRLLPRLHGADAALGEGRRARVVHAIADLRILLHPLALDV